jgi:hypothetical protein
MTEQDDIVTRLREAGECPTPLRAYLARAVVLRAADEIERLRKERDELQKWKDAHNTFWRDRAERRDAMREGEKKR